MAPPKRKSTTNTSGTPSHHRLPHQCLFCSNVYQGYKALEVHMNQHTEEHPYECNECPSTFTDHRYLRRHHHVVHRNKRYPCNLCSSIFKDNRALRRHQDKTHHEQISSFDRDSKRMSSKTGNLGKAEKFIDKSSEPRGREIETEESSGIEKGVMGNAPALTKPENIIDRKPVVTVTKSAVYKCSQCPTTHLDRNLLLKHAADCHGRKTFECPICQNLYTQQSNVRRHLKTTHLVEDGSLQKRRTRCSLCHLTFESFPHLLEHKKIQHDLKLFKCTYCPNEYTQYCNMARHRRKSHHQEGRPRVYTTTKDTDTTAANKSTTVSTKALEQPDKLVDEFPVFVSGREGTENRLQDQAHQQLLQMITHLRIQKEEKLERDMSFFLHLNRYDPSSV